ncbi:unnamed protein product [Closterium sp. NIES-54]
MCALLPSALLLLSADAAANRAAADTVRCCYWCCCTRCYCHPAATTAVVATACATSAAARSVGGAVGAGGAGGVVGSAGGAAGAGGVGGFGFLRTAQQRQQSQQETFSPQLLSELFSQRCVPRSVEAAALGASESAAALGASQSAAAPSASESAAALGARASPATDPALAKALHTFTLDSGASRCFFRDCTTLTPLVAPVPVSLADPTGGPLVARASTVLPSCSVLLVSGTLPPNSPMAPPPRPPLLPCLPSMHPCLLVSGLPRSLPSLPRSPTLPCLPCVEGRQRAAPHSSEFPPTTAPLQTLHKDVWDPAPVNGMDQECYFLLVVDNCTRYTNVFPLRRKADVSGVLIPWIRATHRQLRERFRRDLPVLRLHCDNGGEFSSSLLKEFCQNEGIRQTLTLPTFPQQNGIAERRIGLIMVVARTSMIHAAAPYFLWSFAARYTAHQLNFWPRVSEPETSPTFRWTGKVGDASVFRVQGALSLVRNAKASKLSSRTLRCVFLGFPTDAPPWQFYHLRERRVFSSQDVTFDKCGPAPSSVSQVDPPLLVEPLEISSDSSGLTEGGEPAADDTATTHCSPRLETPPAFLPLPSSPPPQPSAVDSGAETAGAEPGGAETEGEGSKGVAIGGAGSGGAANGGANSGGDASPSGGRAER